MMHKQQQCLSLTDLMPLNSWILSSRLAPFFSALLIGIIGGYLFFGGGGGYCSLIE